MSESIRPPNRGPVDLDEIVERFETAWHTTGEAHVEEFLPPANDPRFNEIAGELLRIDLERRAKTGRSKSVEEYKLDFPDLLKQSSILEGLAFEEYRLRSSVDASLKPAEFARRYGIRTQHWPKANPGLDHADTIAHSVLTNGVADEMSRIASVAQLPEIGEQFLDFELVEELGQCQFGRVYVAKQRELSNRQVVIKVSSNLWLESERLARLQHTNIVPVYSVHEYKGLQTVCMPFLGKQTLRSIFDSYHQQTGALQRRVIEIWSGGEQAATQDRTRLRQQEQLGRFTHEQICTWILAKVAAGLSHAHDRGILHRDLKPANILMTDDFEPMILDFNLSDDAIAGGQSSLIIGGTLPYMSPEHLMAVVGEGDVDRRSDLYSLGVILFQLLTGKLPFKPPPSSTIGALSYLLNDRSDIAPSVRSHEPRLSTDVDSIVMRCLASNPEERYQTAREFHDDLERHLQFLPPKHAPIRSRKEQISKWAKRHPRATSSTAIISISSILVTLLIFFCVTRGRENAGLVAKQAFDQFKVLEMHASAKLCLPGLAPETTEIGLRQANSALDLFGSNRPNWTERSDYHQLSKTNQTELRQRVKRLHYLVAAAHLDSAKHSASERTKLLKHALTHNSHAEACEESPPTPAIRLQRRAIKAAQGVSPKLSPGDIEELGRHERDTSSALLLAMHHMRNKDFNDAETILQPLFRKRPKDLFAWLLLANCQYGLGRPLQADSCFTSAVALFPDSHTSFLFRGICRMQSNRFLDAEDDFTHFLKVKPGDSTALLNRAIVRIKTGNYQGAVDDLTTAIDGGRDDSLVYLYRARAYSDLGKAKLAEPDFQRGTEKTPICVQGWILRGLAFRKSSPKTALNDLDAALAIDPDSKQALRNKVALLSQLNRNEDAINAISKLAALSPNDPMALLGRGLLHARLGHRDAALADCKSALELGKSPTNHYQAARILANTSRNSPSDSEAAAVHLKKALLGHPHLVSNISRDPDLQPILQQPKMQSLLAAASKLIDETD